ncbi:MAG: methylated-DNA--[protein]-cysteine S-methyltransferase [Zetaproteobacteria bacterium]|nr:methylated-DNA--[protein]-cysteine S-methyltransferase [Zetaproteobacteria bacterium]
MRISAQIFTTTSTPLYQNNWVSPLGPLCLVADDQGLRAVLWDNDLQSTRVLQYLSQIPTEGTQYILEATKNQLQDYFSGHRLKFELPLSIHGTFFQRQAWQALQNIDYGATVSYKAQALALGRSSAYRAVGHANSQNPLSIIVPCHRVVRHNQELGGYAGGITRKRTLLLHEQRVLKGNNHGLEDSLPLAELK